MALAKDRHFLKYIASASNRARKNSIKKCNKSQARSLCQVCRRVATNQLGKGRKINFDNRKQLLKYKRAIRALINPKIPFTRQKRLLTNSRQRGGAAPILPLILSLAGPLIASLFNNKNKKKERKNGNG
jgi:hypothetical protein